MTDIYLKIYVENGNTLVFEGQGAEDKDGYYPTRWDKGSGKGTVHRIGTVVVGQEHIVISEAAKDAFRKIVREAKHTGDDISCIDIHDAYKTINGKFEETPTDICISYLGDVVSKFNIDKVIKDDNFFIGYGEGGPKLELLDQLMTYDSIEHDDLEDDEIRK